MVKAYLGFKEPMEVPVGQMPPEFITLPDVEE
jgi:hypothetical protein